MANLFSASHDTIAAIATPRGVGGISLIRVSGSEARAIAARVFTHAGKQGRSDRSWNARFGRVHSADGQFIDEAIMLSMPAPRSYTREDVVELSCHGGPAVAAAVLQAVLSAGARHAAPGEFTQRAFLNGRISLIQAEAVLQMVNARTERARRTASEFLAGQTGETVLHARDRVVQLMASIEAWLDFPDDDVPGVDTSVVGAEAGDIACQLRRVAGEAEVGRILWEGVSVAIVGRPNVGKSRLLNALLREERAIVSDKPGTTRDIVAEVANIRGIPVRLIDTAGMRTPTDAIEAIGVERAKGALADADIALAVVNGSRELKPEDHEIVDTTPSDRAILVLNKADLEPSVSDADAEQLAAGRPWLRVSALTGQGLGQLEELIESVALSRAGHLGDASVEALDRRADCLRRAALALDDVAHGADEGQPADMLSIDLRTALDALGELTGETAREEIIDLIFRQFCVGK